MVKMVEMKRDDDSQTDSMPSFYDDEYPIGFFLDPKMVSELGLKDAKAGDEFKIMGTIKIKSLTETTDKKELYVCIKELGIDSKSKESPTDKMKKTYGEDDDQ